MTPAPADVNGAVTEITGALTDLSQDNLLIILVAALGVTVVLFLCWFAYRFIKRKVAGAIKSGRL